MKTTENYTAELSRIQKEIEGYNLSPFLYLITEDTPHNLRNDLEHISTILGILYSLCGNYEGNFLYVEDMQNAYFTIYRLCDVLGRVGSYTKVPNEECFDVTLTPINDRKK